MRIKTILSICILLFTTFTIIQAQKKMEVNSKDVNLILQNDKKIIVLDVRTADEFNEGHIKGAKNIDIKQADAFSKIDILNHKAKYMVYCHSNRRSGIAVDHMIQSGFKNIYQMMDGFPGWVANKFEVQK